MKDLDLVVRGWPDCELLDSGNSRKLERYGKFILIRPETQAIWEPRASGTMERAHTRSFGLLARRAIWKKMDADAGVMGTCMEGCAVFGSARFVQASRRFSGAGGELGSGSRAV